MTILLKWKKILGSGQKRKVISESLGHKENVGMLRCFRSWHQHWILIDPMCLSGSVWTFSLWSRKIPALIRYLATPCLLQTTLVESWLESLSGWMLSNGLTGISTTIRLTSKTSLWKRSPAWISSTTPTSIKKSDLASQPLEKRDLWESSPKKWLIVTGWTYYLAHFFQ